MDRTVVLKEYKKIHEQFFSDLPIIRVDIKNLNNSFEFGEIADTDLLGIYARNIYTQEYELFINSTFEKWNIQEIRNTIAHELIHQANHLKEIDDSDHGEEFRSEAIARGIYDQDFDAVSDLYLNYSECVQVPMELMIE